MTPKPAPKAKSPQQHRDETAAKVARWQALPAVAVNFQPWHAQVLIKAATEALVEEQVREERGEIRYAE